MYYMMMADRKAAYMRREKLPYMRVWRMMQKAARWLECEWKNLLKLAALIWAMEGLMMIVILMQGVRG